MGNLMHYVCKDVKSEKAIKCVPVSVKSTSLCSYYVKQ